jgi:hypothetical protein
VNTRRSSFAPYIHSCSPKLRRQSSSVIGSILEDEGHQLRGPSLTLAQASF